MLSLSLLQRLADTEDRRHLMGQDGVHLGSDESVRLTVAGPPFGMSGNDVGDAHLGQHRRAHLAREGAFVFIVAVLRPEGQRDVL